MQIQLLLPQCDKAPGTPRYPRDYNKNENVYVYDDSSNDNHNTDKHQQPRQPTTIDEAYDGDDKNNNRDINTDQQYNDNHAQQRRRRRRQFSSDSPKRQANVCSTIDFGFTMPRTTTCEDAKRTREDETKTCNRHIVGHTLPRSPEGSDTGGGGQGRRTDNETDRTATTQKREEPLANEGRGMTYRLSSSYPQSGPRGTAGEGSLGSQKGQWPRVAAGLA